MERKLTPLQQRYVDQRLKGLNQTDAYVAAGGTATSEIIVRNLAYRMEHRPAVQEAMNAAKKVAFERNVGSVEYIINECVAIVKEAREGGPKTLGSAVAALNLLAKRFPEFRDPTIDMRQVNLVIPEGTSIEDIKALRDQLRTDEG